MRFYAFQNYSVYFSVSKTYPQWKTFLHILWHKNIYFPEHLISVYSNELQNTYRIFKTNSHLLQMKHEENTLKFLSRILPQQLRQCGCLTISVGPIIGVAHMCSALTCMLLLILLCLTDFDENGTNFLSTVCMTFMKCLWCNLKAPHRRVLLIVDIGTMYLTQYINQVYLWPNQSCVVISH